MQMVIDNQKKELRHKLLQHLLSLTKEETRRRSKNVEEKLSSLPIYKESKVIMVYYPLPGEVDILDEIRKEIKTKRFCFPVMDLKAKKMRIFEVKNLDEDFIPGPYKIMEPDIRKTKETDIGEIDLVIVPGLAFDYQKNRLGRGVGFYDRFLADLNKSTKKVGIAFEFQILESLPVDLSLDQKVDAVVSESFDV